MFRSGPAFAPPAAPPGAPPPVPSSVMPAAPSVAQPGTPPIAARRWHSPRLWLMGSAGALALAAIALALANDGALLERILAPLAAMQQPLVDIATNGRDGPDGVEYVLFLRDGAAPASLAGFFRDHPSVRYVSPGLLPGVAVIRIRGEPGPALAALRDQPQVRLALKSRLGMVCH